MNQKLEQLFIKYEESKTLKNDSLEMIEIGTLSKIIEYIESSPDNSFTFLAKLDDSLIEKIIEYIEPKEEQEKLKGSILFIKGIVETCLENEFPYTFNQAQSLDIMKFIATIKQIITNVTKKSDYLRTVSIKEEEITKIKEKLLSKTLLTPEEYEIIHKMCKIAYPINTSEIWDEIITILNDMNLPLLRQKYEEKQEPTIDPFKEPKKNISKVKSAEKRQKIKEIMAVLGYDLDKMDIYAQNILLNGIPIEMELMANSLINTGFNRLLRRNNERGLAFILTCNKSTEFENMLDEFKTVYHLEDKEISLLAKYAARVFTTRGYINFKQNYELLQKNNISISSVIHRTPSFFSDPSKTHEENFKYLTEHGINIPEFVNQCSSILKNGFDIIINNLKILEKYHYDLHNDHSSYSVLCSIDLATTIDQFIELGLNEYIHTSPSIAVKNMRALVVKRIYFAQKNNRPIWRTQNTEQTQLNGEILKKGNYIEEEIPSIDRENNPHYDALIALEDVPSEEEITKLIGEYPDLERIDAGYRPIVYTDNYLAQMKYKTELTFGTTIISRLKAYRAFKALKKIDVPDKEALLYSLSYNSILEQSEYDKLKRIVYGNQLGEKTI